MPFSSTMLKNYPPNRRQFLRRALAVSAATSSASWTLPLAMARPAASERVTLGVIGTGNQGFNDIRGFLGDERVQIVAVCDVNRGSEGYWNGRIGGREPAKQLIEQHYAGQTKSGTFQGCDTYADYRELLARNDFDAVLICTPDHWHALPVIAAAEAGLDMYCQKPLSLFVREGRLMSDAVAKSGVVFQTGSQQRSDADFRRACELVRNGAIGKLHTVRVGLPGGRKDFAGTGDQKQTSAIPQGFDYDTWLGPAPQAPYAPARCHVNFRWIFDYSGGMITDWGAHHVDCAHWGMGADSTGPVKLENIGAAFPPDPLWNTATEFHFEAIYADGVRMIVSDKQRMGVTWEGSEGSVWATRRKHDASSTEIMNTELGDKAERLYHSENHYRNFVDCVYSREATAAPVETAHRSITVCHLANIAMRLGRETLTWDPKTETITDDTAAAAMLARPYRSPWKLG